MIEVMTISGKPRDSCAALAHTLAAMAMLTGHVIKIG